MHNLCADDLRVVPDMDWTTEKLVGDDARKFATHARAILENCRVFSSVPEAVADCVGTFAFSARLGRSRCPRLSLADACAAMVERLGHGRVALLFGSEDRGLEREDLLHATHLVHIPAPGGNPVFNLAQSVLLALWELCRARLALDRRLTSLGPPVKLATSFERQKLRDQWSRILESLGYHPAGRGTLHARILRRLVDLVERGGNERNDFALLYGIGNAIGRALQRSLSPGGDRTEPSRTRDSGPPRS